MSGDVPGILKTTSHGSDAAQKSASSGKFGRFSVVLDEKTSTGLSASQTSAATTIGTVKSESLWDRFVDLFFETLGYFQGTSKADWERTEALLESASSGYAYKKIDSGDGVVKGPKVELAHDTRIGIAAKIMTAQEGVTEEQKERATSLLLRLGNEQETAAKTENQWHVNFILQDSTLSTKEKAKKLHDMCNILHKKQPSSNKDAIIAWTQNFIRSNKKLSYDDREALLAAFCQKANVPVPKPPAPTATEVHELGQKDLREVPLDQAFRSLELTLSERGATATLPEKLEACREFTTVLRREIAKCEAGEGDQAEIDSVKDEFIALQLGLGLHKKPLPPELNTIKQDLEGANRDLDLPIY